MSNAQNLNKLLKVDPIEYLVNLKYPQSTRVKYDPSSKFDPKFCAELRDIEKYRTDLKSKTPEEIQELYIEAQAEDDKKRFFNLPEAYADLELWSKMCYWTIDEGIALLFLKNPEKVNHKSLEYLHDSPFAIKFFKIQKLANRAVQLKLLNNHTLPENFLAWAERNGIKIPDILRQKVEAESGKLIDWKRKYIELYQLHKKTIEEFQEIFDENNKMRKEIVEIQKERINKLIKISEDLSEKLHESKGLEWDGFDENSPTYSEELAIAVSVHRVARKNPKKSKSPKKHIREILEGKYTNKQLGPKAKERISTICNWNKKGGVPKTI